MHHFTILLNAIDLHFVHEKSKHKNAIPLLLTHGWPGSFLEFTEIIPQLVNPGDKKTPTIPVPALALLLAWKCPCLTFCPPLSYPCQACAPVFMLTWSLLFLQCGFYSVYLPDAHTGLTHLQLPFAETSQAAWDYVTIKAFVSYAVALLSAIYSRQVG